MNPPTPKPVVSLAPAASQGPDTEPEPQATTRRPDARSTARAKPAPAATTASAFVPLVIGLIALLAWVGFQTWLLTTERSALQQAHEGQQQTVENAGKLRTSLDALAADTQRLADTGNANAALLVAELKKRGITINPNTPRTP